MRTVAIFPADEILPHLGTERKQIKLAGFSVNTGSARLECFRRNQTCVCCGVVGTMFALQTHVGEPPHLNFFHITKSGKRILMTKDHIIPKSRGGGSRQSNLQTMCTLCNHKKSNSMPGDHRRGVRGDSLRTAGRSMNLFACLSRPRKPIVADLHKGFYRAPAERVVDPPLPRKPISFYIIAGIKAVFGFIPSLFLAILGMIAVGTKMAFFYLILCLASIVGVGVGALGDITTHPHAVVGGQVALVILAVVCFFIFLDLKK
jgi:5-methylcytosine-specific restriction endonuclease McrA